MMKTGYFAQSGACGVLLFLLVAGTSKCTAHSNLVACYSPKSGVPCAVIGPYNIAVKCQLPSNRELFSNYVDHHPGCMIVEDKKLYRSIRPLCFAKDVPSTLCVPSSSPLECLCVSSRCLYRAYWSRKLIAINVGKIAPSPSPSPSPSPTPGNDLKCADCEGTARCHQLPNQDIFCTIPEEANCTEEFVDSTKTKCIITLEVRLDSVTEESIHFKASTEPVQQPSNPIFEARLNDSEKATFISRCTHNENNTCNNQLAIPAVYWRGLLSRNETRPMCYTCSNNLSTCRPDQDPFCQIPKVDRDSCGIEKANIGQSCSLGVLVYRDSFSYVARVGLSRTKDTPSCSARIILQDNTTTIYECSCNRSFCNGIITSGMQVND